MDFSVLAILLMNGVVWGLVIALLALGLSLTFGLVEVMNLAHGEFYMWGAVIGWYVIPIVGSFWLAIPVVTLAGAAAGLLVERLLLRRAQHMVTNSLILTFGLALVMQHVAMLFFGGAPQRLRPPEALSGAVQMFGLGYPVYRFFLAAVSAALLALTWLVVHHTRLGLWMRAVKWDRGLALSQGIPVDLVYCLTFGLGSGLASLAGLLAAPIVAVEFRMGTEMLPLAFMAVILGGFGDLKGSVLAAIFIGVMEGMLISVVSPTMARVLDLIAVSLLLLIWPDGLRVFIQTLTRAVLGLARQPKAT